jgi:hypothetical protein
MHHREMKEERGRKKEEKGDRWISTKESIFKENTCTITRASLSSHTVYNNAYTHIHTHTHKCQLNQQQNNNRLLICIRVGFEGAQKMSNFLQKKLAVSGKKRYTVSLKAFVELSCRLLYLSPFPRLCAAPNLYVQPVPSLDRPKATRRRGIIKMKE